MGGENFHPERRRSRQSETRPSSPPLDVIKQTAKQSDKRPLDAGSPAASPESSKRPRITLTIDDIGGSARKFVDSRLKESTKLQESGAEGAALMHKVMETAEKAIIQELGGKPQADHEHIIRGYLDKSDTDLERLNATDPQQAKLEKSVRLLLKGILDHKVEASTDKGKGRAIEDTREATPPSLEATSASDKNHENHEHIDNLLDNFGSQIAKRLLDLCNRNQKNKKDSPIAKTLDKIKFAVEKVYRFTSLPSYKDKSYQRPDSTSRETARASMRELTPEYLEVVQSQLIEDGWRCRTWPSPIDAFITEIRRIEEGNPGTPGS